MPSTTPFPDLDRFLREHRAVKDAMPPLVVFDCDGTLIKGDIGESMFYFQLEEFLFRVSPASVWSDYPKKDELDTLYHNLAVIPHDRRKKDRRFLSFTAMLLDWYFDQLEKGTTAKACADIVRLFAGFSTSEVRQIANVVLDRELQTSIGTFNFGRRELPQGIRFIRETRAILEMTQELGYDVWVVSGSNRWSVEAVCKNLRIPPGRIIGIDLHQMNGVFTSKEQTPIPILEGKVETLRQIIPAAPILVVSDSHYDHPLFRYSSGKKVLVNSGSSAPDNFFERTSIARDNSWLVIENPTFEQS